MQLGKEKTKEYVEFELDLSPEEEENLVRLGKELILEDRNELINYAVNILLRRAVDEAENSKEEFEKKIEKIKEIAKGDISND